MINSTPKLSFDISPFLKCANMFSCYTQAKNQSND